MIGEIVFEAVTELLWRPISKWRAKRRLDSEDEQRAEDDNLEDADFSKWEAPELNSE